MVGCAYFMSSDLISQKFRIAETFMFYNQEMVDETIINYTPTPVKLT